MMNNILNFVMDIVTLKLSDTRMVVINVTQLNFFEIILNLPLSA